MTTTPLFQITQQNILKSLIAFVAIYTVTIFAADCHWKEPKDLLINDFEALHAEIKPLPASQIREDLDCLGNIFHKQYVASHFFSSVGIDLPGRVSKLASTITTALDQRLLLESLIGLHQDAFDSHLMYSFYAKTGRLNSFLPGYGIFYIPRGTIPKHVALKTCDGLEKQPTVSLDGKHSYNTFVGQRSLSLPFPETVTCQTYNGSFLELPLMQKFPEKLPQSSTQFSYKILQDGILYIRIPRFSADVSEQIKDLIPLLAETSQEHPLLFDLRQNPGGSDRMVRALGQVLRIQTKSGPNAQLTDMDSLYSVASQTNSAFLSWQWAIATGKPPGPFKSWYDENLKYFEDQVASGKTLNSFEVHTQLNSGGPGSRATDYLAPIVLLVDKGCASACDGMITEFSNLPNVTILGTNSYGAVQFGNQGALRLPNSNLLVMTGWREIDYPSTPVAEGLGYSPDFYILEQDSLATAINYIRRISGEQFSVENTHK